MRCLTVVLAEDEPVISLDITNLLEEKGFRVIQVPEQDGLLRACVQFKPDLAILNYNYRDQEHGMMLASRLKQGFGMQILLLTGARPQDIAKAPFLDARLGILHKPFTRTQLRQRMQELLQMPA